mmetsp:Transcript_65424/g.124747  ORF Transcript_65424/g.124747 Transcript_65424/m.124747 type:complete len:253 (+) Transcript_65424:1132-1890(+)
MRQKLKQRHRRASPLRSARRFCRLLRACTTNQRSCAIGLHAQKTPKVAPEGLWQTPRRRVKSSSKSARSYERRRSFFRKLSAECSSCSVSAVSCASSCRWPTRLPARPTSLWRRASVESKTCSASAGACARRLQWLKPITMLLLTRKIHRCGGSATGCESRLQAPWKSRQRWAAWWSCCASKWPAVWKMSGTPENLQRSGCKGVNGWKQGVATCRKRQQELSRKLSRSLWMCGSPTDTVILQTLQRRRCARL